MPSVRERSPKERETLMFDNPEAAREFSEQVGRQLEQSRQPGVDQRREIVAQRVAQQFEREGEAVNLVRQPWIHTQEEHEEAQHLVDIAFEQDLRAALKAARSSDHYPRNVDLFHDVLTSELYRLVADTAVNRQPVGLWVIGGIVLVLLGALLIAVLAFL